MPPLPSNFAALLPAARTGADWAWAEIYNMLAPPLLGYLRAGGAGDPEDILGEVFVQMVRDLPRFDGDESAFRAWVFTIAHHRLVDARRYSGRRPVEPMPDEAIERHGPTGDVEEEALESLANERVRRLIEALPAGQRDVLLLRILGGLTVEQVSKAVGKRAGAVKALQRRGLAALKKALEREGVPL